jgi:hypothetical protein
MPMALDGPIPQILHPMSTYIKTACAALILAGMAACVDQRDPRIPGEHDIFRTVVYKSDERFAGWPANNGIWYFSGEDRILVGFTSGAYNKDASGHKISDTERLSYLATSSDGGATWKTYDPDNYLGDGQSKKELNDAIDFTHAGFAMRIAGTAYHGTDDEQGRFYYSYNYGKDWQGPYPLGKIHLDRVLEGKVNTARTDYVVLGKHECMVMISAKPRADMKGESGPMTDKTLCIKTNDGGKTFEFISWIVPLSDPCRAVMPNTVKISKERFITVLRRKTLDTQKCWVDAYGTEDGGYSWRFLSRVGETGVMNNGNPPAIALLRDGSLCVAYGNRDHRRIMARYSIDEGKTWGDEFVIRENNPDYPDADIGYPRLVCRRDGSLVAVYYWVSREDPVQYIEAARWIP